MLGKSENQALNYDKKFILLNGYRSGDGLVPNVKVGARNGDEDVPAKLILPTALWSAVSRSELATALHRAFDNIMGLVEICMHRECARSLTLCALNA